MLVPKSNRVLVYTQLFKDGVMTAKKDPFLKKHHDLPVPNLHVMKLLQSLHSRGYVTETFSWQWYYWRLTDAGVEHLREYLFLTSDVVPNTQKAKAIPKPERPAASTTDAARPPRRDRDEYRGASNKDGAAPRDFEPRYEGDAPRSFRGGRGRGRGGFRGGRGGAFAASTQPQE
jgi:small subunit ribosomal protein S10e